jgi:nucleotide-binding universal stress UspA family protein
VALAVVTALEEGDVKLEAQARAREYLQHRGATASFVIEQPPVAQAILTTAEAHGANMIVMGGYGLRPELAAHHPTGGRHL